MRIDAESSLYDIIELMLRPQGASVQEVCSTLGCQRSTFYRYQTKLSAFGIPFYEKDDYRGNTNSKRWYIDGDEYSRGIPVRFDHTERMMLRTILERTHIFDKTRLKGRMDGLRAKLNAALLHDRVKPITTTLYSFKGSISYEGKEEIIERLCVGIEERREARVTYKAVKAAEAKTYGIEPLTLVDHNNALYVIVAVPKHDRDIRILAVDRIRELTLTEEVFTIPEGFDPEAYLTPSFGITVEEPMAVKIRFTGDAAFYARERTWGQDQHIEETEDGIILSFTAAGFREITAWALSWGRSARVLEPEALRAQVQEEHEAALEAADICKVLEKIRNRAAEAASSRPRVETFETPEGTVTITRPWVPERKSNKSTPQE